MLSITLMDIINIESSLGEKILCDNKSHSIICCNNTCSTFNKITKEEIKKYRDEYFLVNLPKKIDKTIKRFAYLELGFKSKKYISKVEKEYIDYYINIYNMDIEEFDIEYEEILDHFGEKINNSVYYYDILQQMIKQIKNYIVLSNNYIRRRFLCEFYRIMLINYYVFIKCIMKYTLAKKDFEGEEHLILALDNLFIIEIIE